MRYFLSEKDEKEYMKAWSEVELGLDLSESLNRLTKIELDEIRRNYDLKGLSTLNKGDLIEKLVELIPINIIKSLYSLDYERYSIIRQVIKGDGLFYIDDLSMNKVRYFKERGLIFTGSFNKQKILYMPREIIDAIVDLVDDKFVTKMKRNSHIVNLANGLLYHYGYIKFDELCDMILEYLDEDIDHYEVWLVVYYSMDYYEMIHYYRGGYYHYEVEDEEWLEHEIEIREDIDYFKFTKPEILNAAREDYVENTGPIRGLRKFIRSNYIVDEEDIILIFREIHSMVNNGYQPGDIIGFFSSIFPLENESDLIVLAPLLIEVHNNTRMWLLKGHTPNMLSNLSKAETQTLESQQVKDNVFSINTKKKIGRNDPCPCGSGLKFKKCCGS